MASAQIIILQDGQGSAPGVSIDTLKLGELVTLRNSDQGNLDVNVWQWTLVGRPLGSTATLAGSQSAVAAFTPDVPGTYMVQLDVNGGGQTGETQVRLAVVREAIGGGRLPELLVRIPGPGEGAEANWDGNTEGYWPDLALLLGAARTAYVDADTGGGGPGPGPGPGPGQDTNGDVVNLPSVPGADVVVESLGEIPPNTVWTFEAKFSAASSSSASGAATSSLIHLLGTAQRGATGSAQVDFEMLPKPGSMSGDSALLTQNPSNLNEIRLVWRSNTPSGDNVTLNWTRVRTTLSTLAPPP